MNLFLTYLCRLIIIPSPHPLKYPDLLLRQAMSELTGIDLMRRDFGEEHYGINNISMTTVRLHVFFKQIVYYLCELTPPPPTPSPT